MATTDQSERLTRSPHETRREIAGGKARETTRLLDGLLVMTSHRVDWATLLRRSHDLDVLECPRCHGRLRPMAVVRDKAQARRFLAHLTLPHEPRALAPARDPTPDFGP
jgi:hypothetical protein